MEDLNIHGTSYRVGPSNQHPTEPWVVPACTRLRGVAAFTFAVMDSSSQIKQEEIPLKENPRNCYLKESLIVSILYHSYSGVTPMIRNYNNIV